MPPINEQTAWDHPVTRRASRTAQPTRQTASPSSNSRPSAGHQLGLHAEDMPHHTTQGQKGVAASMHLDSDVDDAVYAKPRMPMVVKKYNYLPVPTRTRVEEEPVTVRVTPLRFFSIALGVMVLAFMLAILLLTFAMPAFNRWNDDRVYGYPRTIHAKENVGHGTAAQPYSDFTGENIDGYIYVFEVEETDPSQKHPQAYFINRYSGQNKDLLAVTGITFTDENGDNKVDMLVTMENGSMVVLYNNGQSFTATAPK